MNFTPLNVTLILAGIVLIYAALRDVDPRNVVKNALKGKATLGAKPAPPGSGGGGGSGSGLPPNQGHSGGGGGGGGGGSISYQVTSV